MAEKRARAAAPPRACGYLSHRACGCPQFMIWRNELNADGRYDGDVESSSTIGGTPVHPTHPHGVHHQRHPSSPTPVPTSHLNTTTPHTASPHGQGHRAPTPKASRQNLVETPGEMDPGTSLIPDHIAPTDVPVAISNSLPQPRKSQTLPLSAKPSNAALGPPKMTTRPKELPLEDIRAFVQRAIEGRGDEDGVDRWWKTSAAPEGKVVRVYADGVYDLFHFGWVKRICPTLGILTSDTRYNCAKPSCHSRKSTCWWA